MTNAGALSDDCPADQGGLQVFDLAWRRVEQLAVVHRDGGGVGARFTEAVCVLVEGIPGAGVDVDRPPPEGLSAAALTTRDVRAGLYVGDMCRSPP
jgi:hypothetical protein